jgi:hypothetical protein
MLKSLAIIGTLSLVATAGVLVPEHASKHEGAVTYTESDFPKVLQKHKGDRLPLHEASAPPAHAASPLWGPGPMPDTCVSSYVTPRVQIVFPGQCLT